MLYIIGLGLDKKDLTLKGLEAVKGCKKVYLENYTSTLPCSVPELEKIINKKIILADRSFVEEKNDIIQEAKEQDVALLVMGDPLSATTHAEILLRAEKMKVKIAVVHSVSIFNAISETGLQLYKFGKTASIPTWQPNFKPESFYDIIKDNLKINAHTLLLIDIGLDVGEALSYLKEISDKQKEKDSITNKPLLICSKIGTENQKIVAGKLDNLLGKRFDLPACIVIPSKLHFLEEEALKKFKNN